MAVCTFWGQHHVKWRLEKLRFPKLNPQTHKTIASREQLALAFTLIVHKAQGQEYECPVVDCHSMFVPGQMAVAIGRAKTLQGLQIINYNPDAARLIPQKSLAKCRQTTAE